MRKFLSIWFKVCNCKISDKCDKFLLNYSNLLGGPLFSGHSVILQFCSVCSKFCHNSILSQVHVMSYSYVGFCCSWVFLQLGFVVWFLSWIGNPQRFPREISGQFRTTMQNLPWNSKWEYSEYSNSNSDFRSCLVTCILTVIFVLYLL